MNRLLEPFGFIRVLVTATDWANFFSLRLAPDAQPEIRDLARAMKQAMADSTPVRTGEHMPYLTTRERTHPQKGLISAARCARVSYMTFDDKEPDVEADIQLARRLLRDRHMTPFEHQAFASEECGRYANLTDWVSQRFLFEHPGEA